MTWELQPRPGLVSSLCVSCRNLSWAQTVKTHKWEGRWKKGKQQAGRMRITQRRVWKWWSSWMPGEMKRSTSCVQKNQGKVNNVHSIIQVLKEKPELSREDRESNLLHSNLCTWQGDPQMDQDSLTLLGSADSKGRRHRPWGSVLNPAAHTWNCPHTGCPSKCELKGIKNIWKRAGDAHSFLNQFFPEVWRGQDKETLPSEACCCCC